MSGQPQYRLFSWEHSYFSGKVRSYLRYKDHCGGLGPGYEDILATQEIIIGLLVPATGENAVPQLQTPDGEYLQDSSVIIDHCEQQHPSPAVIPWSETCPRQMLASYLIELLADEWMIVYGFWERWHYSLAGVEPNHLGHNEQQWGVIADPHASGTARAAAGRAFFDAMFSINAPEQATIGPYLGLKQLGMTEATQQAWCDSNERILERLETHLDRHDYLLGGMPTLGDFALLAPLYAHLFRDAVPGFEMRSKFPLVAEWVERTVGTNALNARTYGQTIYHLGPDGELVGQPATSDSGKVLAEDLVPDSVLPLLDVFFEEMWPVLDSSVSRLTDYLGSGAHPAGMPLPGKSFGATPGAEAQLGDGALTHEFEIGGVRERRMVVPYQVWMLQRLAGAIREACASGDNKAVLARFLERWPMGTELLALDEKLAGCRLRKVKGLLYAEGDAP